MEWQYNRSHIQRQINIWAIDLLSNKLPTSVIKDLLTVSNAYTVDYQNINTISLNLKSNIPEYILKTESGLVLGNYNYVAKNLTDWDDLDDFKAKLALRHRYGFSKRLINNE